MILYIMMNDVIMIDLPVQRRGADEAVLQTCVPGC
jgi:hypothetical protein